MYMTVRQSLAACTTGSRSKSGDLTIFSKFFIWFPDVRRRSLHFSRPATISSEELKFNLFIVLLVPVPKTQKSKIRPRERLSHTARRVEDPGLSVASHVTKLVY